MQRPSEMPADRRAWGWLAVRNGATGALFAVLVPEQPKSLICTLLALAIMTGHDEWRDSRR